MATPARAKTPEWRLLEQLVAAHYLAIGYKVISDINLNGSQVDLLCTKNFDGAGLMTIAVEVKHRSSGVIGVRQVREFKELACDLRDRGYIQNAVMISNVPYSQDANASGYNDPLIKLLRLDDLKRDLFSLTEPLMRTKNEYEADRVFPYYIPLAARAQDTVYPDAVALLHDRTALGGLTVVIGDFGTGKTTILDRFFYEKICARIADVSQPYPIKLRLRTLLQHDDLWRVVSDELRENQYLDPTRAQFDRRLENGELVICLDGFDEIKTSSDAADRARFLEKLSPLITSPCPSVLTTRPTYFETLDEMIKLVSRAAARDAHLPRIDRKRVAADAILGRLGLSVPSSAISASLGNIVEIEMLSKESCLHYLSKYEAALKERQNASAEQVYAYFERIYAFPELMQRPLLLEMIATTAIEGGIDLTAKDVGHVGPSMIFDSYTQICAQRDLKVRSGGLDWNERLEVARILAMAMFQKGVIELDAKEVIAQVESLSFIRRRLRPVDGSDALGMSEILTDIRVCGFLGFSQNGSSLRFRHKSLFEFFVAQHIVMERLRDYEAFRRFTDAPLTREILFFLGSFARDQPEVQQVVKAGVNRMPASQDRSWVLCRRIAFAAGKILENLELVGNDVCDAAVTSMGIAGTTMRRMTLTDLTFRDLECHGWTLEACELIRSTMASTTFTDSCLEMQLHRTELDDLHLLRGSAAITGVGWTIRHSTFEGANVQLGGRGTVVDLVLCDCPEVSFQNLSLAAGARMRIERAFVSSSGHERWCPPQSGIELKDCCLGGLWISPAVFAELVEGVPSLELSNCAGIIFSELDLVDLGSDRMKGFEERYPEISVIAEPAIRRAIRRARGETVSLTDATDDKDPVARRELEKRRVAHEAKKLGPAKKAIEDHGMTATLESLYDELRKVVLD